MTTTFSVTRDEIIAEALMNLQVLELGVTPDATTVTNSARVLNLMIKSWQTKGIKLWTIAEITLPLVADTTAYIIGPNGALVTDKPLKLIQAWLRNTSVTPNVDTPIMVVSKQEYNMLGSKASTGNANTVFYDPGVTNGILYVYLTPDAATAASYEMHLVVQKPLSDVSLSTTVPDFPNEWMNALIWGLTDQLAIRYSIPMNHRIEIAARAKAEREACEDFDVEYSSTFFSPDPRMR